MFFWGEKTHVFLHLVLLILILSGKTQEQFWIFRSNWEATPSSPLRKIDFSFLIIAAWLKSHSNDPFYDVMELGKLKSSNFNCKIEWFTQMSRRFCTDSDIRSS